MCGRFVIYDTEGTDWRAGPMIDLEVESPVPKIRRGKLHEMAKRRLAEAAEATGDELPTSRPVTSQRQTETCRASAASVSDRAPDSPTAPRSSTTTRSASSG